MSIESYLRGVDVLVARQITLGDDIDSAAEAGVPARDGGSIPPPPWPSAPPPELRQLPDGRVLQSELDGVSDEAWTAFALAMKTAAPSAVSASNAHGMFEMKLRRLADLGLVKNLTNERSPTGRMVWVGEWVAPLTRDGFLASPKIQYRAFSESMRRYVAGLRDGSIPRPSGGRPVDMTLSGVLAILHRCGPYGLKTWSDPDRQFEDTRLLYEAANDLF